MGLERSEWGREAVWSERLGYRAQGRGRCGGRSEPEAG